MEDTKCPYCKAPQEICHDDGEGYTEDEIHEQECSECEKVFIFTTSIIYYYNAEKAPCKNGGSHDWKQAIGWPKEAFIGIFRCQCCGEEKSREPMRRGREINKYLNSLIHERDTGVI